MHGMRCFAVVIASLLAAGAASKTVVVTGATGRSGVQTYKVLKALGFEVRGVVRNTTKARQLLGCKRCDASDGIFLGDVTKQESLSPAMSGADFLVITVGVGHGEDPKDILFEAVNAQVAAFAGSTGPPLNERQVVLMSMMNTQYSDTWWMKIVSRLWGGFDVGFFSLNGEAALMNSNIPFTILKACGLSDGHGGTQRLVTGHDGVGDIHIMTDHMLDRADVAQLIGAALLDPGMSRNLRFDVCASSKGERQEMVSVLQAAMKPWDPRRHTVAARGASGPLVV